MSVFGSLPNVHPVFVHFPIALFVAAAGFDVACLSLRRRVWLDSAAVILHVGALLTAAAAALTGALASRALTGLAPVARQMVDAHGESAFFTLVIFAVVTMLRLETSFRDRGQPELRRGRMRLVALAAAVGALLSLYRTVDLGGRLVYEYGVGVGRALVPAF